MKRLFISIAALSALAFSSCTRTVETDSLAPKYDLTFAVEADAQSRVGFAGGKYFWDATEQLGVYIASAVPTYNVAGNVSVIDGTGYCTARVNQFAAGDTLYAYFPYSADNIGDASHAVVMAVAPVQRQSVAGTFIADAMPMVALPQNLGTTDNPLSQSVLMRALGGIIRVKVYASGAYAGERVSSVEFATESTPMSGEFTIDITNPAALEISGYKANSVMTTLATAYTVPATKGECEDIYMVVAPGDYAGTFTVVTDKAIYTYNYSRQIERNTYYDLCINLSNAANRLPVEGEWGGGLGTLENPYIVASAADLQRLSSLCNAAATVGEYASKHYRQICEIDMSAIASFTPICSDAECAFSGSYDGGNYKISNIKVVNADGNPCGLFGYATGATLKNISIIDGTYTATALHCGAVAGVAEDCTITDCYIGAEMQSTATDNNFEGYNNMSSIGGVAGHAIHTRISGCTFAGKIGATSLAGGIAGFSTGSTISDCTITSSATIDVTTHFVGGIVGRAGYVSTIRDCTINGKVSSYNGNYCGGVTSHLLSGVISGCHTTRLASISSKGDHVGGIVGALQPKETAFADNSNLTGTVEDCLCETMVFSANNTGGICGYTGSTAGHTATVRDCEMRGSVSNQTAAAGGITGYINAAGNVVINNCTSFGTVSSTGNYAGGIAGSVKTAGTCLIEGCKSYGDVASVGHTVGGVAGYCDTSGTANIDGCIAYGNNTGLYSVGGIVGYYRTTADAAAVNVVNCVYAGDRIEATGNNGANGYTLASGLIGWIQVTKGKTNLVNCASFVKDIYTQSKYGANASSNNTGAGMLGFQNGTPSAVNIYNCYSVIAKSGFHVDGAATTPKYYGGVYAKIHADSYGIISIKNCYHNPACQIGPGTANLTQLDNETVVPYTDFETLLTSLNNGLSTYDVDCGRELKTWCLDNGVPVIDGMTVEAIDNPNISARTKRISVIGDSISTFRGFVPNGYACHYPTSDGDLTSVSQTYWYLLAHDLMSDAVIDRNIAYSGTAVARTTNDSYSSNYWYGNDFCARFIAQNGIGNPDIVIIHGGTNDYAHNADPLAEGVEIRSATAPANSVFESMFATADAATTRTEIEALDDTTFCTAYIKLMCLIGERYPDAKVVCVIGDYLTTGIEQSIIKIAEHYGARCVDLLAVNGYNDQTYMPKHDYDPATGKGCHPSATAMRYIAEKIYRELGDWLEE